MSRGLEIVAHTPEHTSAVGEVVGRVLSNSQVIALCGPLGAGKTKFTQGLARGLGVPPGEPVVSPTFVLVREYVGRLRLLHLDAYRLASYREMLDLGLPEMTHSPDSVVVIEWADRFPELMAVSNIRVDLRHVSESDRGIAISAPAAILRKIQAALKTCEALPGAGAGRTNATA